METTRAREAPTGRRIALIAHDNTSRWPATATADFMISSPLMHQPHLAVVTDLEQATKIA